MSTEKKPIKYRIVKIDISQFSMFHRNLIEGSAEFGLQISINSGYNPDARLLKVTVGATFTNNGQIAVNCETATYFELDEVTAQEHLTDGDYVFTRDEMIYFGAFCIGTLRGVLAAKLEKTEFSGLILPPVNVYDIITGPLVISMPKDR